MVKAVEIVHDIGQAIQNEHVPNGTLEQVELEHITRVLQESGGIVTHAATRLGVPRTTLNGLMRKFGISRANL